jgi:hypothetical protein
MILLEAEFYDIFKEKVLLKDMYETNPTLYYPMNLAPWTHSASLTMTSFCCRRGSTSLYDFEINRPLNV